MEAAKGTNEGSACQALMQPRTRQLLDTIRKDPDVRAALGDTFDFYLLDEDHGRDWFIIDGDDRPRVIARKGSGCVYVLHGAEDRLAYISSEGQAGVIAESLEDGLAMIVAIPYWGDLIGVAPDDLGDCLSDLEDSFLSDIEDLDEHRALVRARLGLHETGDEPARLHRAVTTLGADFVVRPPGDPDYTFEKLL